MIVLSDALVLSGVAGEAENSPLVGWHTIVTASGLSADTEDSNYPAVNLANPSTALRWLAADSSEQYLTVITGDVEPIDYVAIARHNLGSAAIAVSIEGRADSGGAFSELVAPVLLADDLPALFRFAAQSLYDVRLRLQAGNAPATVAVVYAGRLLVLPRRLYVGHTPIPYGRKTQVTNGRSESGNFLGRIVTGKSVGTSVALKNLAPDWYRATMEPFVKAAQETPFFFAWRPASYPAEIGYAWITNDPQPSNQRNNGMMQIDLQLGGIAS